MKNPFQKEIPLSIYWKLKFPTGRPTLTTLRTNIRDGILPGRIGGTDGYKTYTVFVTDEEAEYVAFLMDQAQEKHDERSNRIG